MEVKLNFKGGGLFINLPPIFSEDAQLVYLAWKKSIMLYSTKTGKLIHEYRGLKDDIAGFSVHSFKSQQCLTACSVNGQVIAWKCITHFKLFEKNLAKEYQKVKSFKIVHSDFENQLSALVSYKVKDNIKFVFCELVKKNYKEYALTINSKFPFYCDVSREGKYFAVAQEENIYFLKIKNFTNIFKQSIKNFRKLTCVACHPTEEIVLTGDSSGRVLVWQAIFRPEKSQAVFHWHTNPTKCVAFSTSGSYFYSGGEECVLVKWQLDNPNEKVFVPRLPAPIHNLAVADNNVYVAVATEDNAVRIFDCRLNQTALIQQLVLGTGYENCGIKYDNRTKALVMNGTVGHIQFYTPNDMTLLYTVDIVGQNKITNERNCSMKNIDVVKLAISKSGNWMATVEERKDEKMQLELRLKFFLFEETKQIFELNTNIELPHEESINSIEFQPVFEQENEKNLFVRCITVGNDKKFKIWQLIEIETVYDKKKVWSCASVGYYRDLSCRGLSFSVDGSLMAIAFDATLTTWLPDTCELKCSLTHIKHKQDIIDVKFGSGNQCHLLVAASKRQLSVWNLLTLSMIWTVSVPVSILVADSLSPNMAVITEDDKLFVFSPDTPVPTFKSETLLKRHKIVAAALVPSRQCFDSRLQWFERSHLYLIDNKNELYCMKKEENEELLISELNEEIETPFAKLIPSIKKTAGQIEATKHIFEQDLGHKTIRNYLEAPLHTMVPIRLACGSLIQSLIIQKENTSIA